MPTDEKDRHILAQLDKNARMSLAAIGREIGLSRSAVRERITRMEERGVIRGFRVLQGAGGVNATRGLIFVGFTDRPCEAALEWLAKLPGARRVYGVTGDWDAVLVVTVAGPADLARVKQVIDRDQRIGRSVAQMVQRAL